MRGPDFPGVDQSLAPQSDSLERDKKNELFNKRRNTF